jgi:two-component system, OmpR family, sensor kinase
VRRREYRRWWLHHHDVHHHRWHHYFGAHLHRRLFMWFGASIFVSLVVSMTLLHTVAGQGPGRGRRLLGALVGGMILWLASGKIAYRIARPLYELLRVTREIGDGRLSARMELPDRRFGEIALLARAINDMAARIERQIGDQRELLAGVSHEIRTPLARIRVLLEIGRAHGGDAKTLDEIEREVLEIDALVGQLLASARLDFAQLDLRPLDAADVARRALERAGVAGEGVLAVERGAATGAGQGGLRFQGDPTLLARALANLLDNARRHGRGVKALRVRARPGFVTFDVDDAGPGFPAAGEKPERPEGSLGLGLVLVRRIADAHKGALTVGNRPEGGARATLELPVT